jgi:subtilase family serine protease
MPAQIVQPIDNSIRVPLSGTVHPAIKTATDLGTLSSSEPLARMLLVLKPSDAQQTALRTLLDRQQTKSSPLYHKWLTPAQFSAQFAPAASDVQKITAWLQQQGFTDVKPAAGGRWIEFSGTANTVNGAFQTSMHRYQVATSAGIEEHIANASEISIPQAIAPAVKGMLSLNNFFSKPMHTPLQAAKRNSNGKLERVHSNMTTTDGNGDFWYYLAPGDVQTIYGASSLISSGIDGTGVSIAIVGRNDIELSDVQTFRSLFGLPVNDPNFIVSGPDPGFASGNDQMESSLDVEWAGAVAPKATINFVVASSTDTTDGVSLAAAYAVENVVSPILSLSYGDCEEFLGPTGNEFWNAVWEQAAAEGISVFVAAGDSGAASCDGSAGTSGGPAVYGVSVSGLASTPYNVAVGGTQFAEGALAAVYWNSNNNSNFSSALGYIPEAAWNMSCDPTLPSDYGNCPYGMTYYSIVGGGGGASNCSQGIPDPNGSDYATCTGGYAKPAWQVATGVPSDGVRDLPDVSLNASPEDDAYILCVFSSCQYTTSGNTTTISSVSLVGGTSASAPTMASIMALVEEKNGQYLGQPNYTLYKLAATPAASSCNSSNRTDPTQTSSCIFNDITSGNNSAPGLPGYGTATPDYTTTVGYDLATGLGSVNAANLVANWDNVSYVASTAQLTAGATTGKHGQPLQLSVAVAGVSGSSGTPSGDIAISTDKYGTEGQYTLTSAGTWSGSISDLPGGTYNLSARYAGDATFGASTSNSTSVTITPENSVATLNVDIVSGNTLVPVTGSLILGEPIYFKASVTGASGEGVPTGTINIMDGTKVVASGPLNAAGGLLLYSSVLGVGTHSLTAAYAGDNSFNSTTSTATSVTISKGETVTFPSATGAPVLGEPTILTATVAGTGTVLPTGTVQFFDNGTAISGAIPIATSSGYAQATFTYTYTTASNPTTYAGHILTASYNGDANYSAYTQNPSAGYPYAVTVYIAPVQGTAATTTTLKMTSASTIQMGQIATFVVTVTPTQTSTQVPTGMVWIFGNGSPISSVTLTNGAGIGISYMDGAGTYKLSAQYDGDSNFLPSITPVVGTLTVPLATPAVSFTTTSPYILAGTQTSLNFSATGIQINQWQVQEPSGTVTFADSVNGGAAQVLGTYLLQQENGLTGGFSTRVTLPTGTNVLTAIYSGNANFNPTTSTQTVIVDSPDFTFDATSTSLTVSAGASGTIPLSLTPVLGFTGNVALSCASGVPAGATCSISPTSLALSSGQTATVTLATLAPSPTPTTTSAKSGSWKFYGGASLAMFLFLIVPRRQKKHLFIVFMAIFLGTGIGCGGSGSPKATLLSLTSSATKVASGASVTFTATLEALESNPTGSVTFYDGDTAIANNVAFTQGAAQFETSSLNVGGHVIKAVYSGDTHDETSTSSTVTQVITGSTTLQITATSGSLSHAVSVPVTLN